MKKLYTLILIIPIVLSMNFYQSPAENETYIFEEHERIRSEKERSKFKGIDPQIIGWAKYYSIDRGIPLALTLAIIKAESQFNPNAVGKNSGSKDIGLMQLNNKYWKTSFDIKDNISTGTVYLKECYDNFDSLDQKISAYNMGFSRTSKGILNKAYVNKVKKYYYEFIQEVVR